MNFLLLLIFALLPFSVETKVFGVWVTSTDILVLLALIVGIIQIVRKKTVLSSISLPLILLISLLMATFVLSVHNAINPLTSWDKIVKFGFLFAFFYLLVNNISKKEFLIRLIYTVMISVTVMALYFIINTICLPAALREEMLITSRMWKRDFFSAIHLNLLGSILAVSIPLCLFCLFNIKSFKGRILIISAITIQGLALALTYSRANWLALAIILVILFAVKYKLTGALTSVELISLPFLLLMVFFPKVDIGSRLMATINAKEGSYMSRLEHLRLGFKLFKMKPLFGIGIGNYQTAAKKYLGADVAEIVHNIFLQCAVDSGILCALIMLILIIKYFSDAGKIFSKIRDDSALSEVLLYVILSFGALIISSQFGDPFTRYIKEYFALLLALPYAIKRIYQEGKKSAE